MCPHSRTAVSGRLERLPEIIYGSKAAPRVVGREFGWEPVESGRSGLLGDGEDDGSVGGIERVGRFRLTSTV